MPKTPTKKKKERVPGKIADGIDIPKELQELKTLSRTLFDAKVNELFFTSIEDLKKKAEDKKASAIDGWLARIALKGARTGDVKALQFLIDRTIGPIKEQKTIIEGHMSWVQYIEETGVDDFEEDK